MNRSILVALILILALLLGCSPKALVPLPSNQEAQPPSVTLEIPTTANTTPTPQLPSLKIFSLTDYLKSISNDLYEIYANFGLDENVASYITFVSTLQKEFFSYALTNKLCIQDKKITDLEKQFLKEPDKYLKQMFDGYLTEISTIDPDMATQLSKLPYFKTLEIKDVEAIEDFLWLVSNSKYKSTLEKLYGKGIDRKMHSVALEALLWRAFTKEYDIYNPLEDPDYSQMFTKLADFQGKYNQQMDESIPVDGKKPQVMGIEYLSEPMGWLKKTDNEIRFDYALMRWVLGANAVKIWQDGPPGFNHVKCAHEEGLEVWLEFCPVYRLENTNPDISVEAYCEKLAKFAQGAEIAKVEVLVVGHEVDVHLKRFDYKTGDLRRAVDEMVRTARANYSGLVTCCTWDGPWDLSNINWQVMDIIHPQIYKSNATRELTDDEYLNIINKWKNKILGKLMAISEFGSLTISEGANYGSWGQSLKTMPYHYDLQTQADFIDRQLKVQFMTDIYGTFLHCWVNNPLGVVKDWEQVGYGIWDWRINEPKPSFWVVYKYYRTR